jgi:hypothetical protein
MRAVRNPQNPVSVEPGPAQTAVVVSVGGKVAPLSAAGVDHEGECKRTADEVSKTLFRWRRNRGFFGVPG